MRVVLGRVGGGGWGFGGGGVGWSGRLALMMMMTAWKSGLYQIYPGSRPRSEGIRLSSMCLSLSSAYERGMRLGAAVVVRSSLNNGIWAGRCCLAITTSTMRVVHGCEVIWLVSGGVDSCQTVPFIPWLVCRCLEAQHQRAYNNDKNKRKCSGCLGARHLESPRETKPSLGWLQPQHWLNRRALPRTASPARPRFNNHLGTSTGRWKS